ncbi:hypothetical protein QBC32DRAFT_316154 [Pseudoneurospora amorphoporcata]|uniref:Uncharacterized protein n=1 Tax=Pseudoneurospora amorphoporcata TaxID=241081 RepID=A0AAN6NQF0_9PEZI|nr:hypothetical protein QBC32DRAFT_316154 [Pseudoneurospora amorphoporcata]
MSSPAVHSANGTSVSRLLTTAETHGINMDGKHLDPHAEDRKPIAPGSGIFGSPAGDVDSIHAGDEAAIGRPVNPYCEALSRKSPRYSRHHQPLRGSASNPELDGSKSVAVSNGKPGMEPTCTTVASTQPVGIYYPPRRPNIFRARAKHLRFPQYDRKPVASDAVGNSAGAMEEDDEDFSLADLEELQSESKQRREKKTRQFVRMVQHTGWGSRVEDLGAVQEIED